MMITYIDIKNGMMVIIVNSQCDPWQTSSEKDKNWVTAEIHDLFDKRRELAEKETELRLKDLKNTRK